MIAAVLLFAAVVFASVAFGLNAKIDRQQNYLTWLKIIEAREICIRVASVLMAASAVVLVLSW